MRCGPAFPCCRGTEPPWREAPATTTGPKPATPRRLQRAREEGQVAVSRELTTFAGLAAVTLALMYAGAGDAAGPDTAAERIFLARSHELVPTGPPSPVGGVAWLDAAAPFVLAALVAASAAVLLQTRFLLSAKALRPDFSRISPRSGLKRLLGTEALIEAGKSLAKIAVLGIVLWRVMLSDLPSLLMAPYGDPRQLLGRAVSPGAARDPGGAGRAGGHCRGRLSSGCRCATRAVCA